MLDKLRLESTNHPRIWQTVITILAISVGYLGDIDFMVSATRQDHWAYPVVNALSTNWLLLKPVIFVAALWGFVLQERALNSAKMARYVDKRALSNLEAEFAVHRENLKTILEKIEVVDGVARGQISGLLSAREKDLERKIDVSHGARKYLTAAFLLTSRREQIHRASKELLEDFEKHNQGKPHNGEKSFHQFIIISREIIPLLGYEGDLSEQDTSLYLMERNGFENVARAEVEKFLRATDAHISVMLNKMQIRLFKDTTIEKSWPDEGYV